MGVLLNKHDLPEVYRKYQWKIVRKFSSERKVYGIQIAEQAVKDGEKWRGLIYYKH